MKTHKYIFKYWAIFFSLLLMFQSCSSAKNQSEPGNNSILESKQSSKKIKYYNAWVTKTNTKKVKGILYSADLNEIVLAKNTNFIESEFTHY